MYEFLQKPTIPTTGGGKHIRPNPFPTYFFSPAEL
jgi:hypothetical protein